jgi:hypothetical protein
MITQDKVIGNSIIQSSYNYFCECLECFAKEQPAFKYTVNFGTNSNEDYAEDDDTFNFVVYNDVPELIPSHWVEINGETEILYAGYISLAVSVLNPMPISYNDSFTIATTEGAENYDSVYNQEEFNYISDEDDNKIQYSMRLLEAFARFMRRKGINVDNFKFTSHCEIPTPDGVFDSGFYRLTSVLDITIKFAMQNILGKALYDGEELRVWIKSGSSEANKYHEIYNVLDMEFSNRTVDKTFPLFGQATTKTISNQMMRSCTINCPDFDFGGNKVIKDLLERGDLDKINTCQMVIYDGKKYKTFTCVPTNTSIPVAMDKFNGITLIIAITSDIVDFEGDVNG